jgi:hypothetical protein
MSSRVKKEGEKRGEEKGERREEGRKERGIPPNSAVSSNDIPTSTDLAKGPDVIQSQEGGHKSKNIHWEQLAWLGVSLSHSLSRCDSVLPPTLPLLHPSHPLPPPPPPSFLLLPAPSSLTFCSGKVVSP